MKSRVLIASILALSLCACASGEDAQEPNDNEQAQTETQAQKEEKKDDVFKIGETWTVDDNWTLTVNSMTPTDVRNPYTDEEDGDPGTVYIIDYTYSNTGYEDESGMMNGVYFDLSSDQIVDAQGKMGKSYPSDAVSNYPQETPVGATCDAQCEIAVQNPGPVKITVNAYSSDGTPEQATFELDPQ